MSALVIPTSGPGRRRAKAVQRRQSVEAAENNREVAAGRLPVHWVALDTCPCGRVSWLERGATEEERAAFFRDSDDHAAYCDEDGVA